MENRFGFKDLVQVVLLLAVIVVVVLGMYQYERQWDRLQGIDNQLADLNQEAARQSKILRDINKSLQQGISFGTPRPAGTQPTTSVSGLKDPFVYQREAEAKEDYAEGDWLIANMGTKLSKLTPLLSSDVYATFLQNRVLEQLAYRDPETFEWIPQLAVNWVSKDNSPAWQEYVDQRKTVPLTEAEALAEAECPPAQKAAERKQYVAKRLEEGRRDSDIAHEAACPTAQTIAVQLRQGVQFSDGEPFTADDIVWTFDFIMNPKVDAARTRTGYDRVKSVTAQGNYTVVFEFREPFFESLGVALGMSPMSKNFYSKYSVEDFNKSVGLLIGTGPYRMKEPAGWHPGDPLEMVRNERYWGMAGPFNRLYWHEVEEDAAALTMFRNGELDTFGATPEQYQSMIKDTELMSRCQSFKFYSRDGGYSYAAWNQSRAGKTTRFADKRVRQAMTLLIDRQRMADDIFRGFAKVTTGPFGIVSKQNDPNIQPIPYDPKKALALLAEAGYTKKDDRGVLLGPDGTPFEFSLIYNNKNPVGDQMVLQMKDSLARVGIVLKQQPTDWPIMIKKLDTRDFDAIMLGWSGGIETDIFQMFHSSQIADGADNFMSYRNPELDTAIDTARRTLDEKQRMEVWHKCHQILNEDQPYTFLLYRQSLAFIDNRIKNVHETRSGMNYFADDVMPIPWYVPATLQKHKD
ncbi:hypothetical protein BH10PLA1_BH10PLA1_03050 [soil metagenome]